MAEGFFYNYESWTRRYLEEMNSYTWKTIPGDDPEDPAARSVWGIDFSKDLPTILEAQAGEDGVFRVEGERDLEKEVERIRRDIGERMQGDINRMIRGAWGIPNEDE